MASSRSMADAQMGKGNTLMDEAAKALTKRGLSSFFAPKSEKFERAAELFEQAGNAFKLAKAWAEAGDAFEQAADALMQCEGAFDAGSKYKEAGACLVKVDSSKAVVAWAKGVQCFAEKGRWNSCGSLQKSIAEIYEQQEKDNSGATDGESAVDAYQAAADFFENDGRAQLANQCIEKIGLLSGEAGDYARAAECFERLARSSLEKKLTSFGAKTHMIKAIVLILATEDTVQARSKLDEFRSLDYTLEESRELAFMIAIVDAVETTSAQDFQDACGEFNDFKKLDPWTTRMLLVSKRAVQAQEGPVDGEEGPEEEEDLTGPTEEEDLT